MNYTFYYDVMIQDKITGRITQHSGDIPGNNALHSMRCIENMNANTWKGNIYQIALYNVDMETGDIDKSFPLVLWNRSGIVRGEDTVSNKDFPHGKFSRSEDKKPIKWPEKSHPVTPTFIPAKFGTQVMLSKRMYPTSKIKGA